MLAIYENDDKEVCVALCENNYVKIATNKTDVWLKVTNVGGKLCVETIEENAPPKESNK